jgi:hypothetical protein
MEVLLGIWVGHSTHCITDNYTVESLKADAEFSRLAAEEAGLGFHMPVETQLPVARNAPRTLDLMGKRAMNSRRPGQHCREILCI